MQKLLNIAGLLCFCLICYSGFANAKVRFVIDDGDAETFKCPKNYAECPTTKYGIGSPCGEKLYTYCKCYAEYNTVCTSPKVTVTGALSCDGKYKASDCICPSQYQYTSSNCSGDYTLSGSACEGKYTGCSCRYSNVTCGSNQTCSSYKCNNTVCTACKDNCTPSCTSVSSCPSGQTMGTKSNGCNGSCSYCYTSSSSGGSASSSGSGNGECKSIIPSDWVSKVASDCTSKQKFVTYSDGCGGTFGMCESRCTMQTTAYFNYHNYHCWESNVSNCGKSGMYAWVEDVDEYCTHADPYDKSFPKGRVGGYRNGKCFETLEECKANPGVITTKTVAVIYKECCY